MKNSKFIAEAKNKNGTPKFNPKKPEAIPISYRRITIPQWGVFSEDFLEKSFVLFFYMKLEFRIFAFVDYYNTTQYLSNKNNVSYEVHFNIVFFIFDGSNG